MFKALILVRQSLHGAGEVDKSSANTSILMGFCEFGVKGMVFKGGWVGLKPVNTEIMEGYG